MGCSVLELALRLICHISTIFPLAVCGLGVFRISVDVFCCMPVTFYTPGWLHIPAFLLCMLVQLVQSLRAMVGQ